LGRIADQSDSRLLAEIAAGRRHGIDLQTLFPKQQAQRNNIQCEAINALAIMGALLTINAPDRQRLASDPALSQIYYQAVQEDYWRQGLLTLFS
jgi:hypothetical protein